MPVCDLIYWAITNGTQSTFYVYEHQMLFSCDDFPEIHCHAKQERAAIILTMSGESEAAYMSTDTTRLNWHFNGQLS
jgi:hypothetical protein